MDDYDIGNMYQVDKENIDDDSDLDEEELDEYESWLDEEDINDDFMLMQSYQYEINSKSRDHGFWGRDDDGFRGLDVAEEYDTYASDLDDEEIQTLLMPPGPCDLDDDIDR